MRFGRRKALLAAGAEGLGCRYEIATQLGRQRQQLETMHRRFDILHDDSEDLRLHVAQPASGLTNQKLVLLYCT